MKTVDLGSIVKIKTGKLDANANDPQGDYPFFTRAIEPLRINSYSYDCECVLVAGNGDLNVKYYAGKFDAYQRTYIIESRDHEILNVRYLYWFLDLYVDKLRQQAISGVIKYIKLSYLTEARIPLPPLPQQRHIAAVLDKADRLRQLDRQLLTHFDTLLQAVFLEMFGDPVRNEKGWEVKSIKSLGKVATGATPPGHKEGMFGGEIPFITPGDLESEEAAKRYVTEEGASHCRIVQAGSTLVCCIGTVGKTDIARQEVAFNQQINAVEWDKRVTPYYALFALRRFKPLIAKLASSTTLPILKKSSFEKLEIPLPPLPLQQRFAAIVAKVEAQKALARRQAEQSEVLFSSLLQRAFRGELAAPRQPAGNGGQLALAL